MKKVVVVFPNPHVESSAMTNLTVGSSFVPEMMAYVGQKTFEGKSLEVVNTDGGNLIIKEANGPTYAVFKHWIYWEHIK